jgi:hypothetical protein
MLTRTTASGSAMKVLAYLALVALIALVVVVAWLGPSKVAVTLGHPS